MPSNELQPEERSTIIHTLAPELVRIQNDKEYTRTAERMVTLLRLLKIFGNPLNVARGKSITPLKTKLKLKQKKNARSTAKTGRIFLLYIYYRLLVRADGAV